MKKSIFAFGVATALLFASCGGGSDSANAGGEDGDNTEAEAPQEDASIVGTWQMANYEMATDENTEFTPEEAANIKEMCAATKYTFNEDGSMTVVDADGEVSGKYEIRDGEEGFVDDLVMISEDGSEQAMMLSECTTNNLVLGMLTEDAFITLTFTR